MMSRIFWMWICVGALVGVGAASCGPSVDKTEECYIPDPEIETPAHRPAFCQWEHSPEAPEGTYAWTVAACEPVGDNESCGGCDVERIDALLEGEISQRCCGSVEGFLRGCYLRRTKADGQEECCYGAYYFSSCLEPFEGHRGLECDEGAAD